MKDPDLVFRMKGKPPRKTHQGGVRYRVDSSALGGVRAYTAAGHRMEAWQMQFEFERQLPKGWEASGEPAEVEVVLVYPARTEDRLAGDALVPHTVAPDADNLVKQILDSMARAGVGVFKNDAQVFDLRVRKFRGLRTGWVVKVKFGGYGFAGGAMMRMPEIKAWLKLARAEARGKRPETGGLF